MSLPSIGLAMVTFNAPLRLRSLLSIATQDNLIPDLPFRLFEDPWKPEAQAQYDRVAREFKVPYYRVPKDHRVSKDPNTGWSCMQGAVEYAVENTPEDWFLYWTDDVLPTPGAFQNIIQWIYELDSYPVGAIQWPYWNADELPVKPWAHKDSMWLPDSGWLAEIPQNPHWNGPSNAPRPYINLNGAGFALRRSTWEQVGGFSQKTWCLDEDISLKIWLKADQVIVTVPGPPFVHYMGASLDHPPHEMHSLACWKAAGWSEKDVCEKQVRALMREQGEEATWWERMQGERIQVAV